MKKFLLSVLVLSALSAAALSLFACGKKGDGESVGEKIDDALEKDGPMENAGEKVDDAMN